MGEKRVAVLGVTGAVGHRFVQLLGSSSLTKNRHPYFSLEVITASSRSAGRPLHNRWRHDKIQDLPHEFEGKKIEKLEPGDEKALDKLAERVDIAFSALPKTHKTEGYKIAEPIEVGLAKRGVHVFSNAGCMRMKQRIPLIIPEINGVGVKVYADGACHVEESDFNLIKLQSWYQETGGLIVKNPNCSVIGLALSLAPFIEFGLRGVDVTTNQALSGAGFDAYPAGVMESNVLPHIPNEEEKIEDEIYKIMHLNRPPEYEGKRPTSNIDLVTRKRRKAVFEQIRLGELSKRVFMDMDLDVEDTYFEIVAHANRVEVPDGHMEYVFVHTVVPVTLSRVRTHFRNFNPLEKYGLPTSPAHPIMLVDDILDGSGNVQFDFTYDPEKPFSHPKFRPQPKLDVYNGRGMAATIGQMKQRADKYTYYTVLAHNTIRGAAGASILNAELFYTLLEQGRLKLDSK